MSKTLVAIPSMDTVPARFAQSLACLQSVDETKVMINAGSLVYMSRETLSVHAVKMEADYILWLDSDMVFEGNLLPKMMKTLKDNDLDFLTACYFRRNAPYTPVLYKGLDFDGEACKWEELKDLPAPDSGLFEVEGCGFGCVLMKTDIILDVKGRFGKLFTPIGGTGEDLSFCWRARQCGYQLMCDPSIPIGHYGHLVITRDFWESIHGGSNLRIGTGGEDGQKNDHG